MNSQEQLNESQFSTIEQCNQQINNLKVNIIDLPQNGSIQTNISLTLQDFCKKQRKKSHEYQRKVTRLLFQMSDQINESNLSRQIDEICSEKEYLRKILNLNDECLIQKIYDQIQLSQQNNELSKIRNIWKQTMLEINNQTTQPQDKYKKIDFKTSYDFFVKKRDKILKKNQNEGKIQTQIIKDVMDHIIKFIQKQPHIAYLNSIQCCNLNAKNSPETFGQSLHNNQPFIESIKKFWRFQEATLNDKADNVFLYPETMPQFLQAYLHPVCFYLYFIKIFDKIQSLKRQDKGESYDGKICRTTFINLDGYDHSTNWNFLRQFPQLQYISLFDERIRSDTTNEILINTNSFGEYDWFYGLHSQCPESSYLDQAFINKYKNLPQNIGLDEFYFLFNEIFQITDTFSPQIILISYSYKYCSQNTYLHPEALGYLINKLSKIGSRILIVPRYLNIPTLIQTEKQQFIIGPQEPHLIIFPTEQIQNLEEKYENSVNILQGNFFQEEEKIEDDNYILKCNISMIKAFLCISFVYMSLVCPLSKKLIGQMNNISNVSIKSLIFQIYFLIQQNYLSNYIVKEKNSLSHLMYRGWMSGIDVKLIDLKQQLILRNQEFEIIQGQQDNLSISDEFYISVDGVLQKFLLIINENQQIYIDSEITKIVLVKLDENYEEKYQLFLFNAYKFQQNPQCLNVFGEFNLKDYPTTIKFRQIFKKDIKIQNFIVAQTKENIFLLNAHYSYMNEQYENTVIMINMTDHSIQFFHLLEKGSIESLIFMNRRNFTAIIDESTQNIICIGGYTQDRPKHIYQLDNIIMIIQLQSQTFTVQIVQQNQILQNQLPPTEYPIIVPIRKADNLYMLFGGNQQASYANIGLENTHIYLLHFSFVREILVSVMKLEVNFNTLGISSKMMTIIDGPKNFDIMTYQTYFPNKIHVKYQSHDCPEKGRINLQNSYTQTCNIRINILGIIAINTSNLLNKKVFAKQTLDKENSQKYFMFDYKWHLLQSNITNSPLQNKELFFMIDSENINNKSNLDAKPHQSEQKDIFKYFKI